MTSVHITHIRLYSLILPFAVVYLIMLLRLMLRKLHLSEAPISSELGSDFVACALVLDLASILDQFSANMPAQALPLLVVLFVFHLQSFVLTAHFEVQRDKPSVNIRMRGALASVLGIAAIFTNGVTITNYFSVPFK